VEGELAEGSLRNLTFTWGAFADCPHFFVIRIANWPGMYLKWTKHHGIVKSPEHDHGHLIHARPLTQLNSVGMMHSHTSLFSEQMIGAPNSLGR
jgi:hypothetical protein